MEEVSATEDLLREHGILDRALLIYEEGVRRLGAREEIDPTVFGTTAQLLRRFVENYHERLEENYVFPLFKKSDLHADTVAVLLEQHEAGRAVTERILRLADDASFIRDDRRTDLGKLCRAYVTMYRPHSAREDTVLFPALKSLVSAEQLKELGEQFEEQEHRLFGEEGFQKTVEEVAAVERTLGIFDLRRFTPQVT